MAVCRAIAGAHLLQPVVVAREHLLAVAWRQPLFTNRTDCSLNILLPLRLFLDQFGLALEASKYITLSVQFLASRFGLCGCLLNQPVNLLRFGKLACQVSMSGLLARKLLLLLCGGALGIL